MFGHGCKSKAPVRRAGSPGTLQVHVESCFSKRGEGIVSDLSVPLEALVFDEHNAVWLLGSEEKRVPRFTPHNEMLVPGPSRCFRAR